MASGCRKQLTWMKTWTGVSQQVFTAPANRNRNAWRGLGLRGRPPITYEAVNLVGARARLIITRAQNELGFRPVVDYAQAMAEIQASLAQPADG